MSLRWSRKPAAARRTSGVQAMTICAQARASPRRAPATSSSWEVERRVVPVGSWVGRCMSRASGGDVSTRFQRRFGVGSAARRAMVEFRILGPLEVCHDGRVVDLGGPRPRALLAALLLSAPAPIGGDALAQALWGQDAPPTSAKAIRVVVSRLRSALG